jgi:hypothetical protein
MTPSDATPHIPPELDTFVSELLQTTGSLMLIVDHMSRFGLTGRSQPDCEPIPDVLTRLLRSVLTPLVEDYGTAALSDAASLLADAGEIACEEIFLVRRNNGHDG